MATAFDTQINLMDMTPEQMDAYFNSRQQYYEGRKREQDLAEIARLRQDLDQLSEGGVGDLSLESRRKFILDRINDLTARTAAAPAAPAARPTVAERIVEAPVAAPKAAPVAQAVSAPAAAPVQRSMQPSIAGLLASESVAPAAPAAPAARRSQSIEGLLGSLFGGNELEDLMTPQQRAAINQRGLLAAAAALLQAGGPSTRRVSLGQALGSALEAGQTGAERAQQSALTQMLTRQKLEEAKRSRDLQTNISRLLTGGSAPASAGGEITAGEALAAPGMAAGPTVARAAMIGQPRPEAPAMSANELKASQYRQIADVYAASGKGEDAKRFMDIAESLAPTRQEVVGEIYRGEGNRFFQRTKTGGVVEVPRQMAPAPKPLGSRETVTDLASGKQIIVQGYDDGSFKTIEGYGPKREMVLETVDGKTVAIDKSQVVAGQTFGTGISPVDKARLDIEKQRLDMERRRLGISEAEFARNAYERVDTAQGIVYVPKRPGAPIIPITDATGKPLMGASGSKPTEGELNASGFAQRMERAGSIISNLPASAETSIGPAAAGALPIIGGVSQRVMQSSGQQQYKQAADDWIRAKLRKESGAVIGKEEMEQEYITYFPQIGDSDSVKAQKAEARRVATEAMRTSAGRAYQPYTPPPPPAAPKEGDTSKDRNGRNIVFRNGRWEYK